MKSIVIAIMLAATLATAGCASRNNTYDPNVFGQNSGG